MVTSVGNHASSDETRLDYRKMPSTAVCWTTTEKSCFPPAQRMAFSSADGHRLSATPAVGRTRVNVFRARDRASQPHFPEITLPNGAKGKC